MKMKQGFRLVLALWVMFLAGGVWAQEAAKKQPLEIMSDSFEYSTTNRVAIFKGNVVVVDPPDTQIKCEVLTVNMSTNNSRVSVIYADDNVVITFKDKDGEKIAKGKHAVYDAQSNVVTLTGEPIITTSFGDLTGAERVILDRGNSILKAQGGRQKIVISQEAFGSKKTVPKP